MAIEYTKQMYNYSYLDTNKQYREVQSIVSTPNAYVNTGYTANSNTKIDCKFMWHDTYSYNFAFGSGTAYNSNNIELYNGSGASSTLAHYSGEYNCGVSYQAFVPFRFLQDKGSINVYNEAGDRIGGADAGTKTFTCGSTLTIFTINREGYKTSKPQTCYYFKIWDNGTLVRDLKPCIRVADNVAGFYDLANNQFYTAADGNPLRAGSDVLIPNGNEVTRYSYYTDSSDYRNGAYQVEESRKYRKHIRPLSGYTQVRYIQGMGAQRLITDYYPHPLHTKIEMQFASNLLYMSSTQCLWCSRGANTTTTTWTCFSIANNGLRFDYNTNAGTQTNGARSYNMPFTVVYDKNKGYIDDNLYVTQTEADFQPPNPLTFMYSYTSNVNSNMGNYGYYKLYYCKIWHDGVLVRDYIPAERNIDGELGLYDKINHMFLSNQGSGTFMKGAYVFEDSNAFDYDYMRDFPKWTLTERS